MLNSAKNFLLANILNWKIILIFIVVVANVLYISSYILVLPTAAQKLIGSLHKLKPIVSTRRMHHMKNSFFSWESNRCRKALKNMPQTRSSRHDMWILSESMGVRFIKSQSYQQSCWTSKTFKRFLLKRGVRKVPKPVQNTQTCSTTELKECKEMVAHEMVFKNRDIMHDISIWEWDSEKGTEEVI